MIPGKPHAQAQGQTFTREMEDGTGSRAEYRSLRHRPPAIARFSFPSAREEVRTLVQKSLLGPGYRRWGKGAI